MQTTSIKLKELKCHDKSHQTTYIKKVTFIVFPLKMSVPNQHATSYAAYAAHLK